MFTEDIKGLSSNLEALRDFVELSEVVLRDLPKITSEEDKLTLLSICYAFKQMNPDTFSDLEIPANQKDKLDKIVKIKTKEDGKSKSCELNFDGFGLSNPTKVIKSLNKILRSSTRSRLLFNSALISLISAVEWFFSRLLHVHFGKHPQTAISSDKIFSYEDLTGFSTIEDARRNIIEKKVEDILRGSFSEWIKYFRSNLKLSMSYLDSVFDELIETCERRNLYVHNNGVANSIYLSKVSNKIASDVKIGHQIEVKRSYLENRISLFERCCILIAAELWKQMLPSDSKRGIILIEIAFEHMEKKRWDVAEGLSYFIMNDKKLPERDLLVGKMNYWLSMKRQDRWNEIKEQATSEDMSARDNLFQLAWYSLCSKKEEFYKLLPKAVKAGDVDLPSLETFPIFDEIRPDKQFQATLTKLRKSKQKKKTSKSKKTIKST